MTTYLHLSLGSGATLKAGDAKSITRNLEILDEALANERTRPAVVVALHVAAEFIARLSEQEMHGVPLTEHAKATLRDFGIEPIEKNGATSRPSPAKVRGLVAHMAMIASAVPAADAAKRIGVSDTELQHRIAENTLVAVREPGGQGWLIPAFQLTETGEVPHLARILGHLRRHVSADELDGLFSTPQEELQNQTPRAWLIAGRDPIPVERIAAGL